MASPEYQSADFVSNGAPLSRDDREDIGHVAMARTYLAGQELRRRRSDDTPAVALQALNGDRGALIVLAERALLIEVERHSDPAGYSTAAVRRVGRWLEDEDVLMGTVDAHTAKQMKPAVREAVGQVLLKITRAEKVA